MNERHILLCLTLAISSWFALAEVTLAQIQPMPASFRYEMLDEIVDPIAVREIVPAWPSGADSSAIMTQLSGFDAVAQAHFMFGPGEQPVMLAIVREQNESGDTGDHHLRLAVDVNRDSVLSRDELFANRPNAVNQWFVRIPLLSETDRNLATIEPSSGDRIEDKSANQKVEYQFLLKYENGRFYVGHAGQSLGEVTFEGQKYSAILIDQNANGRWTDAQDRLLIDWDADGQFSPLRERYACQQVIERFGNRYLLAFRNETLELEEIAGAGTLTLRLALADTDAQIESFRATLVSTHGVHLTITEADQPNMASVGDYFVKELYFRLKSDQFWSFSFQTLKTADRVVARVENGGEVEFDVVSNLNLYAIEAERESERRILPILRTGTGLYLQWSAKGQIAATSDNRLFATRSQISATENLPSLVKSTDFSCGSFCPILFDDDPDITGPSPIELRFDSGPLAGMLTATIGATIGQEQP